MVFEVEFYQDSSGKQPIKEYLYQLQQKAAKNKDSRIKLQKIYEYIGILADNGTRAGKPYTKHIDEDIWELRPISDRIFYFYHAPDGCFVLLHYFQKKTPKTPKKEIEQAKRNRDSYIERKLIGGQNNE